MYAAVAAAWLWLWGGLPGKVAGTCSEDRGTLVCERMVEFGFWKFV